MKENWDKCFSLVLENEGGFVNNPKDPGGMTNLGVTKQVWESWVDRDVTESEMRSLTPNIVKPLYKKNYWDKIRGDQLPLGVDYAAYDFAVNSGIGKSSRILQQIAAVPADGIIGPQSIAAILACNPDEMIDTICDTRLQFLKNLPTWATFGRGWQSRVDSVKATALQMAKAG